jgi:transposase-like protein
MASESIDGIGELLQGVFGREDGPRRVLEFLLDRAMRAEVEAHVGAGRHERSGGRSGYRNGTKPRTLSTRVGELTLSVPQVRGCAAGPYHPSMFARYQRSERALLVACAEMYFQGVSTRKVRDVLDAMCGCDISSATVSRVAAELDERLAEFRGRRLDHAAWPYLMVDARYERVRVEGRVVSQAVLVVIGFTAAGRREVLDWRVGDSESEQCWGEVFRSLKDRGLSGVELVVSDAHAGIRAALARHFQGAAWQRCRVHFKRELMRKVSYKLAKELMKDAAAVFAPWDRAECLRRGEEMAARWAARCPAAAAMLRDGLADCLTVLSFPAHHRRRLASTNLLERLMRTLKARTAVVGVFPGRDACDRLIGSQLLEVHEGWQVETRPYFNMAHVQVPTGAGG